MSIFRRFDEILTKYAGDEVHSAAAREVFCRGLRKYYDGAIFIADAGFVGVKTVKEALIPRTREVIDDDMYLALCEYKGVWVVAMAAANKKVEAFLDKDLALRSFERAKEMLQRLAAADIDTQTAYSKVC